MQKDLSQVIWGVITVSVVFITVAVFIISYILLYKKRQQKNGEEKRIMQQAFSQQLLQSQIETQEETMSILGKELHDNIGQLLSSTKMLIGITERSLKNPPETLLTANDTLSKAIHELRTLSKSLNKEWLEQFNFIENLSAEAARINSSKTIQVNFSHPAALLLKADEQIILFRIVQEAIQNTLKHAGANTIDITIEQERLSLSIIIVDDGKGFDMEHAQKGLGIINIKHRIALLNGTVDWFSDSHGTKIIIQLPLKENN